MYAAKILCLTLPRTTTTRHAVPLLLHEGAREVRVAGRKDRLSPASGYQGLVKPLWSMSTAISLHAINHMPNIYRCYG